MSTELFGESFVDRQRLIDAHIAAVDFYRHHLLANHHARAYLAERGFADLARADIDTPWRLGYAPPAWTALTEHLTHHGFQPDELLAAGLTRRARTGRLYDAFRDRIMFPIRDPDSAPVAFTGRALNPTERAPKYLNSADSLIYHKGQTLYGLAEQIERTRASAAPVLVEGPLDVIAIWLAHPAGADPARVGVAPCGTSLTSEQTAILTSLPGAARHGITVAFDNDTAGRAATERAWHLLHRRGRTLAAASLPSGDDPADVLTRKGLEALRERLSGNVRSLLETLIENRLEAFQARHADRLNVPEIRVAGLRTVTPLLTHAPSTDLPRLVRHVAGLTGTQASTVIAEMMNAFDRERDTNTEPGPYVGTKSSPVTRAFAPVERLRNMKGPPPQPPRQQPDPRTRPRGRQ